MKPFAVYVLAQGCRGPMEVGVTTELVHAIWQLRRQQTASVGSGQGFTRRLVWYQYFDTAEAALEREKALRQWQRNWLIRLVEKENPLWLDLYPDLLH